MKTKLLIISTIFLAFFLTACSTEKAMIGEWKSTDAFDQKIAMTITDEKITVVTRKKNKEMVYTNVKADHANDVSYYSFEINNQNYSFVFPEKTDHKTALFIKNNENNDPYSGALVYAIHQDEQPNYVDYAKKYFNN